MHVRIEEFDLPSHVRAVAIVGLDPPQLRRVEALFAERGIEVIDGGAIGDGSNMARKARQAAAKAEVTFLNVKNARTLKSEDLGGRVVVHFSGISGVRDMLKRAAEREKKGG